MASDEPGGRSGRGADSVLQHIAQERTASVSAEQPRADRGSATVLVVEDQPTLRYAAVRMLQNAGFRTLEAGLGEEAIALAPAASAVLMDVNLPDMNGIQVCSFLKSRSETARLPVVLTSAVFVDDLHREAGMASGADDYLTSPLDPHRLVATFERLLGLPAA